MRTVASDRVGNSAQSCLTIPTLLFFDTFGIAACPHLVAAMSELRRRIGRVFRETPSPTFSREGTPDPTEEVRVVPVSKLKALTGKKRSKRLNWSIFGLGGLFGLFLAAFFAQQKEVIHLEGLLDLNLESLLDVIPQGIIQDARDLTVALILDLSTSTSMG